MARITKYTIDGTITDSDKLLGTDAESANATKNYLVGDLADYITSDWVAVGSGTYKLHTTMDTRWEYYW